MEIYLNLALIYMFKLFVRYVFSMVLSPTASFLNHNISVYSILL